MDFWSGDGFLPVDTPCYGDIFPFTKKYHKKLIRSMKYEKVVVVFDVLTHQLYLIGYYH